MQFRFVAYNRLGAERGVLPQFLQANPLLEDNELPTLTIHYPRDEPSVTLLENQPEIAFQYCTTDGVWVEPDNARWTLQSTDEDEIEEVPTRSYTFIGIGEALRGIHVYDDMGLALNDEGRVKFGTVTPGRIINMIWARAVSRGWKGFSKSFTDTHDSNGVAWPQRINTSFAMENSGEAVLGYLVRAGMCDFSWSGRTLNLYVNNGNHREKANIANPVRLNLSGGPASIDSGPSLTDREGMASHVVVLGEEGLRWTFPTGAILPEGRREVFLSYSGVDEEATARVFADPTIIKYSNKLSNVTRQFHLNDSTLVKPFLDYQVGDYVLVERDSGWERMRIFSLSIQIDENGIQGYVSLGDKIDTLLERLNEKVQRNNGTVITEGSNPPAPSTRKPTRPTNLRVSSEPHRDQNSRPMSSVTVAVDHNGKDSAGQPIVIDFFQVDYRPDQNASWAPLFRLNSDGGGTYGPLATFYQGLLQTYHFRVRAVSVKGVYSDYSTPLAVTMVADRTPPEKPSKPVASARLGVFKVETDHLAWNGNRQPPDYHYQIIEMSTAPNGAAWVEVGQIVPPIKEFVIGGQPYSTRWFRTIALDRTGNRSEPSDSASATTTKLVDDDLILSEIDAAKTVIKNANKIIISTGLTLGDKLQEAADAIEETNRNLEGPGGLTERLSGAEQKLSDVGSLAYASGQTLRQKLTAADQALSTTQANLTAVSNRVSPLETGLNALNSITIPSLVTSINGKNKTQRSTSDASSPANYVIGDVWEKYTTLGVGGKLLQSWRHDGTRWVPLLMDPTYLPLIDIGAGTFGTLSGGRLEVNSVTADKVLIGIGGNLFTDPAMEDRDGYEIATGIGWGGSGSGKSGRGSILIAASDTQQGSYYGLRSAPRRVTVVPGQHYHLSVWARSAGTPIGGAALYARFYKADGTFVWGSPSTITNSTTLTGNVWTEIRGIVKAPDDVVSMVLGFYSQSTNTVAVRFSDPAVRQATAGQLIVNGTITGDHVEAESVAAKVGTFLKLGVEQLTVTGNATFEEAVANKMFVKMFETNKITTAELIVGKGENLIPWQAKNPIATRSLVPHVLSSGSTAIIEGNGGRDGGPHPVIRNESITSGAFAQIIRLAYDSRPNNAPLSGLFPVQANTTYKLSVWVRAGGTYSSGTPDVRLNVGLYDTTGAYVNGPWLNTPKRLTFTWQELTHEFTTSDNHTMMAVYIQANQPGAVRIDQPMLVKDGASLIATGGIIADHITASESLSAKVAQFLKVETKDLVATGNATLNEAVITTLWNQVVRSRSITTDMLLVGKGTNLVPNGDLANGKEGWSTSFGIYNNDPAALEVGYRNSIWLLGNQAVSGPTFSVKGKTKYLFSVWVRANVPGKRFYVQFISDNGDSTNPYLLTNALSYSGAFRQYEAEFEAPAGATSGYFRIFANHSNGDTTEGHQWFTGWELHEKNAASLIVTGGIVTEHLKITREMTAALLRAKKVEASEIDVNSLAADSVFFGRMEGQIVKSSMFEGKTFEGGTFTGSTFQTHATGNAGVRLSRNGLVGWDSAGRTAFSLSSSGSVSMVGRYSSGYGGENRWVIVPVNSAEASNRAGIWLTNAADGIGGTDTAGLFMDNPTSSDANAMNIRGMNGGGVKVWNDLDASSIKSGIIDAANYRLQNANGSFFNSQVIFNGRITYAGAPSTTSAANTHIAVDGTIWKSSSASRFKLDQRAAELPDSLLDLKFKDWIDKGQVDQYTEIVNGPRPLTEAETAALEAAYLGRVGGVVAEDVETASGDSAPLFVTYDLQGRVEGVAYDRLGVALALKLADKVKELEAKLAALTEGN